MRAEEFYATRYNKGMPVLEDRISRVERLFSQMSGNRLLDIGCGDGTLTTLFGRAMRAKELYGVEIAPEAVAAAKKQGIVAHQTDIDSSPLPFKSNYFDAIYCGEIIEHLFDPDHLLDEVYRVLKPRGVCVLSTPNLAGWPSRLALLLGYQPYPMAVSPHHEGAGKLFLKIPQGQWGHLRVFTLRALRELVQIHHFLVRHVEGSTVTIEGLSPRLRPLIWLALRLDGALARCPALASRLILVLEKSPWGDGEVEKRS